MLDINEELVNRSLFSSAFAFLADFHPMDRKVFSIPLNKNVLQPYLCNCCLADRHLSNGILPFVAATNVKKSLGHNAFFEVTTKANNSNKLNYFFLLIKN
ncbi:hypothetical protein [Desulfogranum japonicum]|uniref:hypothetical protein n=1 Tax=Desulfogranum japonicum TaxID=231447 RepID=UPI000409BFF7|nr:hypothetical protein [Desulfogranum japonicum]